jgi:hypothetical protein
VTNCRTSEETSILQKIEVKLLAGLIIKLLKAGAKRKIFQGKNSIK